ncbi:hypothetical protein Barb4_04013 [Bacteroidales bacterium Barb4]|nr:hypothetical protein Barb4_04013 [Bacteroidales bacterium Barb4]
METKQRIQGFKKHYATFSKAKLIERKRECIYMLGENSYQAAQENRVSVDSGVVAEIDALTQLIEVA